MAWDNLGLDPFLFFRRLHDTVSLTTFLLGIIKAPVFASLIALVGCYEGLRVKLDATSVGRLTTRSVVQSIFLVIRSEEHTSELQSLMRISYAVFCLKKQNTSTTIHHE